MTRLLILLGLFLLTIAFAPALIDDKGYILIKMGDNARETTVTAAVAMLVTLFFLLLVVIQLFKGGLKLSFSAWNKIAFASQRRALRDFNKGVAAYIVEDYAQAEHLLSRSAESNKLSNISYLLAASAADKLGLSSNAKHYLGQLEQQPADLKDHGLEAILVTIKLLLNHQEYASARKVLDDYHKHIGHDDRLLAQEITLSLIEKRFQHVVNLLKQARKSKTLTEEQIIRWESQAFNGVFEQTISEKSQLALHDYWQGLASKVKQRDAVLFAYCQTLANHHVSEPLTKLLLPKVKKGTDETFIKKIRLLPLTVSNELVQAVQKHLHHDPQSAKWLSCLAHLSIKSKEWDRAEKAFNSLVHLPGHQYDTIDLKAFAEVLQHQGETVKALEVFNKIVENQ
ncbi:heme biosynthesis HemY N-terminal domain-containing protein [Thalassotalea ganghwensis]